MTSTPRRPARGVTREGGAARGRAGRGAPRGEPGASPLGACRHAVKGRRSPASPRGRSGTPACAGPAPGAGVRPPKTTSGTPLDVGVYFSRARAGRGGVVATLRGHDRVVQRGDRIRNWTFIPAGTWVLLNQGPDLDELTGVAMFAFAPDGGDPAAVWVLKREEWRRWESNPRPRPLSPSIYVRSPGLTPPPPPGQGGCGFGDDFSGLFSRPLVGASRSPSGPARSRHAQMKPLAAFHPDGWGP